MTAMQQIINDKFFVITGGPGVGKTTLLDGLQQRNFYYVPEIARQLIQEQLAIDRKALPWGNTELYKELMLERSVESYTLAAQKSTEIIFFDRSILDTLCYARLINSPITNEMNEYATRYRYNKKVFILPPWQEIYETDNERKQTWEEAVLTYEMMADTYEKYDYELVEVPKIKVEERVNFVIRSITIG